VIGSVPISNLHGHKRALSLGQASEAMYSVPKSCPVSPDRTWTCFHACNGLCVASGSASALWSGFHSWSYDIPAGDVARLWKKNRKFSCTRADVAGAQGQTNRSLASCV